MNIAGRFWTWFWLAAIGVPLVVFVVWANANNPRQFVSTLLNGVTLAALYFLVASGFTLVFGLMRNVNLAHGSLFLLGAYVGWVVGDITGNWFLAIAAGFASAALVGFCCRSRCSASCGPGTAPDHGHDRHLDRAGGPHAVVFGGEIYSFDPPRGDLPDDADVVVGKYPAYRLGGAGHRHRGRPGAVAVPQPDQGRHDDPRRCRRPQMLAASGVNVQRVFAVTFAIGAGLAGPGRRHRRHSALDLAGRGHALPDGLARGGDRGRHGQLPGAAVGALLIGLAEQFGLSYAPTYGVVFTFLIMVLVLAFRPNGIMGRRSA